MGGRKCWVKPIEKVGRAKAAPASEIGRMYDKRLFR